jgi:PII-like signaling protein
MESRQFLIRLRIYISSTDKFKYSPLYEVIVFMAKRHGIAGATVVRGVMGYGSSSEIHSSKFWELSEKLPMIVEVIDEEEKINEFEKVILPVLDKVRYGCLVTREKVTLILNKKGRKE